MPQCCFKGCSNEALAGTAKCILHRHRAVCITEGCHNQVYARQLCIRHGGKRMCRVEGCGHRRSLRGDLCCRHGAGMLKKRCSYEGCTKQAHSLGRCVHHGGGRKCLYEGCQTHSRTTGYCGRHSRVQVPNGLESRPSPSMNPVGHNAVCSPVSNQAIDQTHELDDGRLSPDVLELLESW